MNIKRRKVLAAGCMSLLAPGIGLWARKVAAQPVRLPQKKYVDVHRHIGLGGSGGNIEEQLEQTLGWMDRYGVMQVVLLMAVNIDPRQEAYIEHAERNLSQISRHSDRFFPFCVIDPDAKYSQSELVQVLAHVKKLGVIGFGEFKPKGMRIDDPRCMTIYAACGEVGLPVLFHTDDTYGIDDPGLPGLEKVLQANPKVTFIAHGPGWWASISGDVTTRKALNTRPKSKVVPGGAVQRLLDAYPNLSADISASSGLNAISRDSDYGLDFLIQYQDRLLFGSDTAPDPGSDTMATSLPEFVRKGLFDNWGHFDFLSELDLPLEVARKIYQYNARRILNLPIPKNPSLRLSG